MTNEPSPAPPIHPLARLLERACEVAELGDDARRLRRDSDPPERFVAALTDAGLSVDVIRLLAHLLPHREAIWWAWECARRCADADAPAAAKTALAATELWIKQPTEEHRRAAFECADAADFGTPAGAVALAVFLSGASMGPPDVPPIPPPPYAAAKSITNSIILSVLATDSELNGVPQETYGVWAAKGEEIARRCGLWDTLEARVHRNRPA